MDSRRVLVSQDVLRADTLQTNSEGRGNLSLKWKRAAEVARHFPPPWTVEDSNDACFIVRDKNRQALAYVYYELESGRRTAAYLLTKDEALRIAANIAKLLRRSPPL